jgi:hypothetical protein
MTSTDYGSGTSGLTGLLPTSLYGADFDSYAGDMVVKGDETKNNVSCVHYQSNSNTGAAGALMGVNVNVTADLWVAKDGNYPVSGSYGISGSAGGNMGGLGFSFDITHVNDASANAITAPTNVMAIPSY